MEYIDSKKAIDDVEFGRIFSPGGVALNIITHRIFNKPFFSKPNQEFDTTGKGNVALVCFPRMKQLLVRFAKKTFV